MKFGFFLNPKKFIFMVNQGNFLGHIISGEGLAIKPNRVKSIESLSLPSNKKTLQSFLGQVNFVRKFINDFSKIISLIIAMLMKYAQFSSSTEENQAFYDIKKAITESLVLKNLDFSKYFIMYTYEAEKSIADIIAQKND